MIPIKPELDTSANDPWPAAGWQQRLATKGSLGRAALKRLGFHSEEMALALVLWLCSLPLIALLVIPFFGPKVAGMVAILLLVVAMAICWGICGWKMVKEETGRHHDR